jgi:hypothetical protein
VGMRSIDGSNDMLGLLSVNVVVAVDDVVVFTVGGWKVGRRLGIGMVGFDDELVVVLGIDIDATPLLLLLLVVDEGEHGPTSFHAWSHNIFTSSLLLPLPPPPLPLLPPLLLTFFSITSCSASSNVSILQYISYGLDWHINIVL